MAKASQSEKPTDETPPATNVAVLPVATSNVAPAFLTEEFEKYEGAGTSKAAEDNIVPLIVVLQSNSPQVVSRNPEYIEGAQPGDIWMRGAPTPIVKGDKGFVFQPCHFDKEWVEWIKRDNGGGLVGFHKELPPEAVAVKDPENPQRIHYDMPAGTEVIETRNHAGYAVTEDGVMPYQIPFSSSGHTVSRNWMGLMNRKVTKSGRTVPSWGAYYRLTTKMRTNKDGDWFVFEVVDAGENGKPLFITTMEEHNRGKELAEAFASGLKKGAAPDQTVVSETKEDRI